MNKIANARKALEFGVVFILVKKVLEDCLDDREVGILELGSVLAGCVITSSLLLSAAEKEDISTRRPPIPIREFPSLQHREVHPGIVLWHYPPRSSAPLHSRDTSTTANAEGFSMAHREREYLIEIGENIAPVLALRCHWVPFQV